MLWRLRRFGRALDVGYSLLEQQAEGALYYGTVPARKQSLISKIFGNPKVRDLAIPNQGKPSREDLDATTLVGREEIRPELRQVEYLQDRPRLYYEYDRMDAETAEVSSALDLFAAEAAYGADGPGRAQLEFQGNSRTVKALEDFDRRVGLGDRLVEEWARGAVKFGDAFYEALATRSGIEALERRPPVSILPNFGADGRQDSDYPWLQVDPDTQSEIARFVPGQLVQVRYGVQPGVYGRALLFSARRVSRQLRTAEDQLVILLLVRAVQRYAITVPVQGLSPEQAMKEVDRWKRVLKRKVKYDAVGGAWVSDNKPLGAEDDIYLPKHATTGEGLEATILQAQPTAENIDGVAHLHRKLLASLKTPAAFLGFEGDTAGRHVITTLDKIHGHHVRRVQMAVTRAIRAACDVELALRGISGGDYQIKLPDLATEDEQVRAETLAAKANALATLKASGIQFRTEWLLKEIFSLEDEAVDDAVDLEAEKAAVAGGGGAMDAINGFLGGQGAGDAVLGTGNTAADRFAAAVPETAKAARASTILAGIERGISNILEGIRPNGNGKA